MKYTIEAIENAKPGMRWEEIGCHWTLGQAYLYSKEAGNDLPNFAEVIWDYDIEAILEDCRKLGVKEFTISSTFSSLIETIYIRTDPAGNVKADKEKSTEKIDGAVATIMGLDRAIRCGNNTGASVYDDRGILFI